MTERNTEVREGYEFWDKLYAIPRYGFIHSSDNSRFVKPEGVGDWLERYEARKLVNAAREEINRLRAEVEVLRKKAVKYVAVERAMSMLECDEREGGLWTACSLLLISSAHKMNSTRSVVEQDGVVVAGEEIGSWRVTVERIDAPAKEMV